MSGGYFDRSTYAMREIADTIERDIARALKPKPEKIQENYWTIYEKDCFGSYHSYRTYMDFGCYDDAESFLLRDKAIVKAEQKYADRRFFDDGVIFQSKKRYMSDTYREVYKKGKFTLKKSTLPQDRKNVSFHCLRHYNLSCLLKINELQNRKTIQKTIGKQPFCLILHY